MHNIRFKLFEKLSEWSDLKEAGKGLAVNGHCDVLTAFALQLLN